MKILINAYACRPNFGSEAGAAWRWITGLAHYHELYVITEGEWREDIEKELPNVVNGERIHFYFNPLSEKIREMCWNQGDYRFYYHYAKWQKKTLKIAQEIVGSVQIDIIHQLNMIGFREPGYLWKINGPKYVWGPIGGMMQVPMQYLENDSFSLMLKYRLKNWVSRLQYHYHPRVNKAIRHSDALIAANRNAFNVLKTLHPDKNVFLINETGSISTGPIVRRDMYGEHFDILFVGRFIPTKLLDLALDVIARVKHVSGLTFHIVGKAFSDADTENYKNIAHKKGLDDICQWYGWIQHDDVQKLMRQSDVFFFPSIVEGTPHVVLESIANGLPVICFDTCGQADAVNDMVGRKVPVSTPAKSVNDFVDVIMELNNDRNLLQSLSDGCEIRRKELSWDNKIDMMVAIYKTIIEQK